jgi:hypothetical protein
MELTATGQQAIDRERRLVHDWRVSQLTRLGIPPPLAEVYADRIDWHQIARLVQRGWPCASPADLQPGRTECDDHPRELA